MRFAGLLLGTMLALGFVALPWLICAIGSINGTLDTVTGMEFGAACALSLAACYPFTWLCNRLADEVL
jgi:hypothetical protein